MINNLCEFKHRSEFIYSIIKEQFQIGRKILNLSDRRGFLEKTKFWLNQNLKSNCAGLYVGGMKPNELRESQNKDIILGTFSMASEGMDIPKLNTIILASPKSDVMVPSYAPKVICWILFAHTVGRCSFDQCLTSADCRFYTGIQMSYVG